MMSATPAEATALTDEARFKLALMETIENGICKRFPTIAAAADHANVTEARLSRLRGGRYDQFSVSWLFALARKAGVAIRIQIEPGN